MKIDNLIKNSTFLKLVQDSRMEESHNVSNHSERVKTDIKQNDDDDDDFKLSEKLNYGKGSRYRKYKLLKL